MIHDSLSPYTPFLIFARSQAREESREENQSDSQNIQQPLDG
jgi:hypothetical protein